MFERFRRASTVVKSSARMFGETPSLTVLPALSLVSVGAAYSVLGAVLLHYGLVADLLTNDLVKYSVLFVALAISSGFGIFFNAAIVHCTAQYYRGEDPSVREGLHEAWTVRATVLKWGLLSATVGTLLGIAEENVPGVGTLTKSVLDVAWAILTFFIVPVIVLEETDSLRGGLEQSGAAFRRTWGESVTAQVGIGLALLPVILVGAGLLGCAYFAATGVAAIALGALGGGLLVAAVVVTQVLGMVVRTALYQYATTGEHNDLTGDIDLNNVFPDNS